MTRILSLDDDCSILELIGLILERAGYEHARTDSSYEALAMLRRQPVDLFTQDIMRPDIDGWQFYRLLKSEGGLRDVPILMITCQAQSFNRLAGLRLAPRDGYLTKPFGPQELLATIEKVLRAHDRPLPTEEDRRRMRAQREQALRRRMQLFNEMARCLPNVRLDGHVAFVQGKLGRYEVSLVTGQVTCLPNRPICIVPARQEETWPGRCVPFEQVDARTEQIISTVLLLSADDTICDETILRQFKEP